MEINGNQDMTETENGGHARGVVSPLYFWASLFMDMGILVSWASVVQTATLSKQNIVEASFSTFMGIV